MSYGSRLHEFMQTRGEVHKALALSFLGLVPSCASRAPGFVFWYELPVFLINKFCLEFR